VSVLCVRFGNDSTLVVIRHASTRRMARSTTHRMARSAPTLGVARKRHGNSHETNHNSISHHAHIDLQTYKNQVSRRKKQVRPAILLQVPATDTAPRPDFASSTETTVPENAD